MMLDLVGIVYVVAAVVSVAVAIVTWRRREQSPTLAVALTFVMVGACWWSVGDAVIVESANETVVAIAALATFPGSSVMVAAFVCLGLAIARPQWVPRRRMVAALLAEPVLVALAAATPSTSPTRLEICRWPSRGTSTSCPTRRPGRSSTRPTPSACLLYTSDAADE